MGAVTAKACQNGQHGEENSRKEADKHAPWMREPIEKSGPMGAGRV